MDKNGFYFHECPTRSRFSHSSSIIWMSRFVIFVKPTCLFTFPSLWYHRAHAPCSLDFSHALSIFCTHYGAIPSTWFPMFLFDKISKKCIGVCSIFTIRFILACYTYIDKGIRTLGQGILSSAVVTVIDIAITSLLSPSHHVCLSQHHFP